MEGGILRNLSYKKANKDQNNNNNNNNNKIYKDGCKQHPHRLNDL